jgi:hypothetical protein
MALSASLNWQASWTQCSNVVDAERRGTLTESRLSSKLQLHEGRIRMRWNSSNWSHSKSWLPGPRLKPANLALLRQQPADVGSSERRIHKGSIMASSNSVDDVRIRCPCIFGPLDLAKKQIKYSCFCMFTIRLVAPPMSSEQPLLMGLTSFREK